MRTHRPSAMSVISILTWLCCLQLSRALQLTEVPTHFNAPSSFTSQQKLVITLRTRSATSRADAEELARLSHDCRVQVMTTASGTRYACKIPLRHPPSAAIASDAATAETSLSVDPAMVGSSSSGDEDGSASSTSSTQLASPAELLDQLRSLCLYRQEGLWTYEVCYKKQTRQFRQAMHRIVSNGQAEPIPAEDFSCGSFAEQQDLSIRQERSATGMPMTYISHNMTSGAPCVMTGLPRTSEVRYTCMPHAKDNMLVLVKEFPTCNYIFVVATPFLCVHPRFQPPPQRTHTIRCTPQEPGAVNAGAQAGEGERTGRSPSPATAVQIEPPEQCRAGQGSGGDGGGTCSVEASAGARGDESGAEQQAVHSADQGQEEAGVADGGADPAKEEL